MLACLPLLSFLCLPWSITLQHAAVCANRCRGTRNSRNSHRAVSLENHNRGRRARHTGSVPTGVCATDAPPPLTISRKGHPSPHRSYVAALLAPMGVAGLMGAGSKASAVVSIGGGCARRVWGEGGGLRLSLRGVVLHCALAWWPFASLLWPPFDSCC
jgi:hypothetical protein